MKKKLENYTFNKLEIKILKEIAKGNHSLPLLIRSLLIKPNLLSYNLKKLLKKRLINFKRKKHYYRKKSRKYVHFSDSKHASLLGELLATYGHIKWENVLSGLGLEILFQVLEDSKITFESFSKVTFWRYSKDFMALGIIKLDDDGYNITPRFSILMDFLTEYQRFIVSNVARSLSETSQIFWTKNLEFLVRVPKNTEVVQDGYMRTATSRLNDLGIPILSDFDIYFYSKKKERIRIEDVILHTLLIEKNNVRYVTYGLLLMKKDLLRIDREYLFKEAQRLDLGLQINAMLQFLETKGARRGLTLPTWREFMAKADEYKVGG